VPGYDPAVLDEFKESSERFFERIFTEDLGVRDILTSTVAYAGPNMAELYDVSPSGPGMQEYDFGDRPGFYSQVPFLSLWAVNNDPDSVHRGVRINLDTLCADPGLPTDVPGVPAIMEGQTNRERYEVLTEGCGPVCHGVVINPIGFAFENYDGLGRYRDMDNGQPVNATDVYPFAEGEQEFTGPAELMPIIANGRQAHQCYAKKLASYALSRDIVESDRPLVESLGNASLSPGASLKEVMLTLVESDAFRLRVGGTP
jgi:hypothetical protein